MLIALEGFDSIISSQIARRYPSSGNASIGSPGFGAVGSYLACNPTSSFVNMPITSCSTCIVGFDFQTNTPESNTFLTFYTAAGGAICSLGLGSGTIRSTFGNSPTVSIFANTWQSVQAKLVISATVGSLAVRVDGVTVLNLTGLNTGTTNIGIIGLTSNNQSFSSFQACIFDNFWAFDDTGTHSNTFPNGRITVQTHYPAADGTDTAWTPNTGTDHFACVDQTTSDDDTTYVSNLTPGDKDSYTVGTLTGTIVQVHGVKVSAVYRKDDVDPKTLHIFTTSGATTVESADIDVPLLYSSSSQLFPEDPNTTAQWTEANVDAIEVGVHTIL